jgi:hypothetical protein
MNIYIHTYSFSFNLYNSRYVHLINSHEDFVYKLYFLTVYLYIYIDHLLRLFEQGIFVRWTNPVHECVCV